MPNFAWKGKGPTGKIQEGLLIADSKDAAAAILRRQQIQVSSLRPKDRQIPLLPKLGGRINSTKLSIFTRQFSVMLDAGLPLVQCLEILGGQEEHKVFKAIINAVQSDVESGMSLAEAMKRHPNAFDNLYVNMIAAGEAGGILDIILQRLSIYIEKAVKLQNQVKSALMYPIAVLLIAAAVVYVILWKVIPVFAQLFAGMGARLPYLTRLVVKASNLVGSYGLWIIAFMILTYIALREWHKTYRGRRVLDRLQLMIPIIGKLLLKISIARFCRTLATLTSSGVPILDGLEITARTSGNAVVEDSIMKVRKSVGNAIVAPSTVRQR